MHAIEYIELVQILIAQKEIDINSKNILIIATFIQFRSYFF